MKLRQWFTRFSLVLLTLGLVSVPQLGQAADTYQLVVHVPTAANTIPAGAFVKLSDASDLSNQSRSRLVGVDSYGWFGVVTMPIGATSVRVQATGLKLSTATVNPSSTREIWLSSAGVPSTQESRATSRLKVSLVTKGLHLLNRTLRVTIGKSVKTYNFTKSGTKLSASIPVASSTSKVKFTVLRKGVAGKTYSVDVRKTARVWVGDFFTGVRTSEAWANNQVKIHYHRADGNYSGWGLHVWSEAGTGGSSATVTWSAPLMPVSPVPDAWGVTYTVPLVANSTTLPYIIHKGNEKDPSAADQLLDIAKTKGEIWFESGSRNGDSSLRYTIPVPLDDLLIPSTLLIRLLLHRHCKKRLPWQQIR